MNRVRISVPTSWSMRVDTPSAMFHATPCAACLPIDMGRLQPNRFVIQPVTASISLACVSSSVNV